MTTAQQLGLVGNSVRVQALPTASAETFGQGNRYYTLIGQQEGYITGHTYHTVVANDVYSWEDVANIPDYNDIKNIPVINQDLTASGFTPVANTYYRHTGATNNTFTQGVIYLYDTAYHKLGESGGGTTLNKYTYTQYNYVDTAANKRLKNILQNAKGHVYSGTNEMFTYISNAYWTEIVKYTVSIDSDGVVFMWQNNTFSSSSGTWSKGAIQKYNMTTNTLTSETLKNNDPQSRTTFQITYWNDVEITE